MVYFMMISELIYVEFSRKEYENSSFTSNCAYGAPDCISCKVEYFSTIYMNLNYLKEGFL